MIRPRDKTISFKPVSKLNAILLYICVWYETRPFYKTLNNENIISISYMYFYKCSKITGFIIHCTSFRARPRYKKNPHELANHRAAFIQECPFISTRFIDKCQLFVVGVTYNRLRSELKRHRLHK